MICPVFLLAFTKDDGVLCLKDRSAVLSVFATLRCLAPACLDQSRACARADSAATYTPAVEKAWAWLSTTALHPDGRVGNCQPGGGAPANNFDANSTSNFCVGQMLLAASEVSKLAAAGGGA